MKIKDVQELLKNMLEEIKTYREGDSSRYVVSYGKVRKLMTKVIYSDQKKILEEYRTENNAKQVKFEKVWNGLKDYLVSEIANYYKLNEGDQLLLNNKDTQKIILLILNVMNELECGDEIKPRKIYIE